MNICFAVLPQFSEREILNSLKNPNISPIRTTATCTQVFLFSNNLPGRTVIPVLAAGQEFRLLQAGSREAPASPPSSVGPRAAPAQSPSPWLGHPAFPVAPIAAATGTQGTQAAQRHACACRGPSPLPRPPRGLSAHMCTRHLAYLHCSCPALSSCCSSLVKLPRSRIKVIKCPPFAKWGAGHHEGIVTCLLKHSLQQDCHRGQGTVGASHPTGGVQEQGRQAPDTGDKRSPPFVCGMSPLYTEGPKPFRRQQDERATCAQGQAK